VRLLAAALALAIQASAPSGGPPLPYVELGACPFECCTYRDWTAEAQLTAYESHDPRSPKKAVFTIASGERVTAMSGLVRTTAAGEVTITAPTTVDVVSRHFPMRPVEKLTLQPGERVYLFAPQGEGWSSGWYNGRILESFDASMFSSASGCGLRAGCTGTVARETQFEWWARIRNARGKIGWVLIPRNKPSFTGPDRCGLP
jgi:hypothetical protein